MCRRVHVPPGRALTALRIIRTVTAALLLCAIGLRSFGPALADGPAKPAVDPRVLEVMQKTGCGIKPSPAPAARAAVARVPLSARDSFSPGERPRMVMVADQESTPAPGATPAPVSTASAPPASAAPEGSSVPAPATSAGATASPTASPVPTPTPTASPTMIPIPAPPAYPGSLIPPTPMATGPAPGTPPPLPTPTPTPTPAPVYLDRSGTPPPIPIKGAPATPTPAPTPTPLVSPTPLRTLAPNSVVAVADSLAGSTEVNQPGDLVGNVHIFFQEGQIVGERAHFDGDHTLTVSGHPYLINHIEDTILYADEIKFDTRTRKADLVNGRGETTEGVETGRLHYQAQHLNSASNGVSHGDRASFTTCENPHGGYHIEAREVDIIPGDKLIARKAVLFLGPLAILYLPLLVIPLKNIKDPRRNTSFIPLIGYDQVEGFWIKARIDFGTSNTYFGYYRIDYFTKRGLGLGYTAFIGSKSLRRYVTIDSYTIDDHIQNARQSNVNVQETENFSSRIRGQFGYNYTGDFGPDLTLPASQNLTGSIVRQGDHSSQNLTVSRFEQGNLSNSLNIGFVDSVQIGSAINQQFNLGYSQFDSPLSETDTVHINTITHLFTKFADYNLTYDKTNYSEDPFGYNRLPELQMLPHFTIPGLPWQPQLQLTAGLYTEPENAFSAGRAEFYLSQPIFLKVFGNSDFSGNYSIRQDWYTTGDEKAFAMQNLALSTPIGNNIVNSITYNEQNPLGPADVPFQTLDLLSSGAHGAQDVLRFFSGTLFQASLSSGTNFNRQAQPVQYQFTTQPTMLSYLSIGGYWTPGQGQGFGTTNVQIIAPIGASTSVQFTTNLDWKNKGRLEDKNIYINKIIGKCYSVQFAYNEDLKQFYFNIVILAFPSSGVGGGFGIGNQTTSIVPQNFAF